MPRGIRFLIVGTGVALIFFVLTWALVSTGLSPFTGTVVAYAIAVIVGYIAQRQWTFQAAHPHARSFPRYVALQLVCAALSGTISHASATYFGLQPLLMSLTTMLAVSAISFLASAYWVFPKSASSETSARSAGQDLELRRVGR